MEYFTDANGWIGVGLGLLIFYMGYIKGVSKARALAPHIIEDILRHDEEV
jgi:mannitol-specific phosphotransferase system IIBC component